MCQSMMVIVTSIVISLVATNVFGSANMYSDSVKKLTVCSEKFAVDLYKEIASDPKITNIVFSPVGISAALAMTKLGARQNSSKQIEKAVYLDEIEARVLNSAFGELNGLLFHKPKRSITLKGASEAFISNKSNVLKLKFIQPLSEQFEFFLPKPKRSITLKGVNGAFISKKSKVLSDYKSALSMFGAQIEELDFEDSVGSVNFINAWISEQTEGLISDMLPEDAIQPPTSLILANTLYFKGDWHSEFIPRQTEERAFHVSHYKIVKTPFMYQNGEFRTAFVESLTLQILEMPYVDQEVSMIALLPDNFDLDSVEKNLNHENLTDWLSLLKYCTIDVTFPKFKIEENLQLQAPLEKLGIRDIFHQGVADLSGISGDKSLYVDEIMHRGVLEVTETGTTAAAAAAIRAIYFGHTVGMPMSFFADHPFLWLIRHNETGQILFLGRFSRPEGDEMANDEL